MDESIAAPEVPESTGRTYLPRPGYSLLWLLLFAALYFTAAILYFGGYTISVISRNTGMIGNPDFSSVIQESVMQHAQSASGISGMYLLQFVMLLPFVFWASHFDTQSLKETLGFRKFSPASLGRWLLILAGFLVVQALVDTLFEVQGGDFLKGLNGSRSLLLVFIFLVAAPLLEETVLRGYLFKAWRRTRLGLTGTLLATSLLFSLLHWGQYGWVQYGFLFVLSVLLGLARERTGSLWVPIILHSANNLLPAIAVIYLGLA